MKLPQGKPPRPGRRIGGDPEHEVDHFGVCPVCGQAFDKRDLAQVLRHFEPEHEPEPRS